MTITHDEKIYCETVYNVLCTPFLQAGRWFPSGTPVSSNNKTDRHDITEMLLKVALNTITLFLFLQVPCSRHSYSLLLFFILFWQVPCSRHGYSLLLFCILFWQVPCIQAWIYLTICLWMYKHQKILQNHPIRAFRKISDLT